MAFPRHIAPFVPFILPAMECGISSAMCTYASKPCQAFYEFGLLDQQHWPLKYSYSMEHIEMQPEENTRSSPLT